MKKKLISILLAGCMAVSLAACGAKEGSAQADVNEAVVAAEVEETVEVDAEAETEEEETKFAGLLSEGEVPEEYALSLNISINPELTLYVGDERTITFWYFDNKDAETLFGYKDFEGLSIEDAAVSVLSDAKEAGYLEKADEIKVTVAYNYPDAKGEELTVFLGSAKQYLESLSNEEFKGYIKAYVAEGDGKEAKEVESIGINEDAAEVEAQAEEAKAEEKSDEKADNTDEKAGDKAESKEETKPAAKVDIPDWFDASFYASQYPDVVNALGNSAEALYNHYVNCGKSEGRMANANDTNAKAEVAQTTPADTSSADSGNGSSSNTGGYEKETWYDMDWYSFIICDHIPLTAEEKAQSASRLEALRNQYRGLVMCLAYDNTKMGNIWTVAICDDNLNPIGKFIWE
jgi:hypothetical protein